MERRSFLAVGAALGASLSLPRGAYAADVAPLVVIVSRSNLLDSVSLGLLRRIFLAEPIDTAGIRAVPFNTSPHTAERVLFDARVLGMSPNEAARYWVDQRIRGKEGSPRAVTGVRLLKQVVARLPGAISYVSHRDLDTSVKALPVGGHDWTHRDYPLR